MILCMDETKFKDIEKKLDSSIRMKFNRLRTFLELGKASAMVGAGFSKKAEMGEECSHEGLWRVVRRFIHSLV